MTYSNTFYISAKGFGWHRSWLFAIPATIVFYLLWPRYYVAILLLLGGALWMTVWGLLAISVCSVKVGASGILLYRFNRLDWADIESVKHCTFLGLPYLAVTRARGLGRWTIPLYLRNERGFYASILTHAPTGNALRNYAESL